MLILNRELLMQDILEVCRKHNEAFAISSNIREVAGLLDFQVEGIEEESSHQMKGINEIYAKVQENSNLIFIYDIEQKKFHQIVIDDRRFFPKCYSYFDIQTKSIYVSGGCTDLLTKKKSYQNKFFKIKVEIIGDNFKFDYVELTDMNQARSSHTMVQFQNNYLLAVAGLNTSTSEIYDIKNDKWYDLPELPNTFANPVISVVKNCIYVFAGSGSLMSLEGVYRMSLHNLERILNKDKGFENVLQWEEVPFMFDMNVTCSRRLKRGMGCLTMGSEDILVFGGFDYDNIFDDILILNLPTILAEFTHEQDDKKYKEYAEGLIFSSEFSNKKSVIIDEDFPSKGTNESRNNRVEPEGETKEDIRQQENEHEEIEEEENVILEEENPEKIKIYMSDLSLPIKTFFNSNILIFDNYLVMIDGYNNAIEFDLKTHEFFYYT